MTEFDGRRRKPYWRETKSLMLLALLVPALVMTSLAFWIERLSTIQVFGFPLVFLVTSHGVIVASLLAMGWCAAKQDEIDRWHGAHEDDS